MDLSQNTTVPEAMNITIPQNTGGLFEDTTDLTINNDRSAIDIGKTILITGQPILPIIGVIANFATFLALMKAKGEFGKAVLLLLQHQAIMDATVCLMGAILMLQPPMWTTGNDVIDKLVCRVWHSQAMYWDFAWVSYWNLILIAFERFLAVRYPFKHVELTNKILMRMIIFLNVIAPFVDIGSFFQTRFYNGTCHSEYAISGDAGKTFFYVFVIWIFVIYYAVPTLSFFVFYSLVIAQLLKRKGEQGLGQSRLVNRAATQITKTAITVTAVFVVSLSYDVWYYMLGHTGAVVYIMNSITQLVGIWLSAFNSFANPFIYVVLLPVFRRLILTTFCPCLKKSSPPESESVASNISGGTRLSV